MSEIKRKTAGHLLESKAIILQPTDPFNWASGWQSPIYCDNRVTLSYPVVRDYIKEAFKQTILEQFGKPDLIAGVATGAIAQGALVADLMELPMIYVRASAKGHGRQNLLEGRMEPGQKVVVVEDLVSTGGSSLKAVEAIREAGGVVKGMVAIFTYGFPVAEEAFKNAGVKLFTLSNYNTLIDMALETGYIGESQVELLSKWREEPSAWKGA
ncbi:MAG: orotate phosphoribosyltransferase [Bacteroidetes bacterium]|nr:orotate phosphoribosyltransferase [Bacteroidota bacterium]